MRNPNPNPSDLTPKSGDIIQPIKTPSMHFPPIHNRDTLGGKNMDVNKSATMGTYTVWKDFWKNIQGAWSSWASMNKAREEEEEEE